MSLPPRTEHGQAPIQARRDPAGETLRAEHATFMEQWMDVAMRPDLHGPPERDTNAEHSLETPSPSGSGQPMPGDVQVTMEHALGADFSAVRIHEDLSAQQVGSVAYAQGTDIVFAPGKYQPFSESGQELLGHELTHVLQQSQGRVGAVRAAGNGVAINEDPALEREADEQGARAARERPIASRGAAPVEARPAPPGDSARSLASEVEHAGAAGVREREAASALSMGPAPAGSEVPEIAEAHQEARAERAQQAHTEGGEAQHMASALPDVSAARISFGAGPNEPAELNADTTVADELVRPASNGSLSTASAGEEPPDPFASAMSELRSASGPELNDAWTAFCERVPELQAEEQASLRVSLPPELPVLESGDAVIDAAPAAQADDAVRAQSMIDAAHAGTVSPGGVEPDSRPSPASKPVRERLAHQTEGVRKADSAAQAQQPDHALTQTHAATSAGPRPRVELTGAANPAQLDVHVAVGSAELGARDAQIAQAILGMDLDPAALHPQEPVAARPFEIDLPQPQALPVPGAPHDSAVANEPGETGDGGSAMRGRIDEMEAAHEQSFAAYQSRLLETRAQGEIRMQEYRAELREQHQVIEHEARARIADARSQWQADHEATLEGYAQESAALDERTHESIATQVESHQTRMETLMAGAEQAAEARKAEREQAATEVVATGRDQAAARLARAGLGLGQRYETEAIRQSPIMRRIDPGLTNRVREHEKERAAECERAQGEAQTTINEKVAEAQEILDQLNEEIEQILTSAQEEGDIDTVEVQNLIAEKLAEVKAIQDELVALAVDESCTEATAAVMRINMHVIKAMGHTNALFVQHAPNRLDELQASMATGYQEAIGQYQTDHTYYLFVAAPDVELLAHGSQRGTDDRTYFNMPFSQMGTHMLRDYGVSGGQMMYLPCNNELDVALGQERLLNQMNTLALLDPDAKFVLSGHSRGANIVLAAAHALHDSSYPGVNGLTPDHVERMLVFDPKVPSHAGEQGEDGYDFYEALGPDGITLPDLPGRIPMSIFTGENHRRPTFGEGLHHQIWKGLQNHFRGWREQSFRYPSNFEDEAAYVVPSYQEHWDLVGNDDETGRIGAQIATDHPWVDIPRSMSPGGSHYPIPLIPTPPQQNSPDYTGTPSPQSTSTYTPTPTAGTSTSTVTPSSTTTPTPTATPTQQDPEMVPAREPS
jgi:hypothetical protein